ncbi:hypothetical protein AVEN_104334-1 [Araneus ventricosus]|uniref:Uncharacterized protein n=1 Tax=Araneus ventricosus TaxID=182803 RepID=A0A4Y2BV78_ARAVE|nr:hypothetical protein AVEN_104334-1 [Araneus ventricosus]
MGHSTLTTNPSSSDTLIPYCTYFSPRLQNTNPYLQRLPIVRESLTSPTYLQRSHFSIFGSSVQMDLKRSSISKLATTPRQFSSDFRTDDRFGRGPTEFPRCGVIVNV